MLENVIDYKISASTVSNVAKDLDSMVREFNTRKIEDKYSYLFLDGITLRVKNISDQLFGQLLAHICGLGYILPIQHVKKAIKSVYEYNYREDLSNHYNLQRTYAFSNEAGLLLCSWPKGGRPKLPFVYSDEVWSGIEYQVATHLIYEGYVDEALSMVKTIRDRCDGYKRNPFNEVKCGHHYARSMASWGLLIAFSGFKYDMVEGKISFDPKINSDNFSCFFSTGKRWRIYSQRKDKNSSVNCDIEVLYGNFDDIELS